LIWQGAGLGFICLVRAAGEQVRLQKLDRNGVPLPLRMVEKDYSKLQTYLSRKRWEYADKTTLSILCSLTGREQEFLLVPRVVPTLRCEDLHKICSLWDEHSLGRYGFQIQTRIWSEVGGMACVWRFDDMSPDEKEALGRIEIRYAKRVGIPSWGSDQSDPTRPGHFPYQTLVCSYGYGLVGTLIAAFARRLLDCGLVDPDVSFSDQA
jgi:hypothetical protein